VAGIECMVDKIKIVFYTETYLVGGAERCLFDLVNHIDRDRFEVSFWCSGHPALMQAARRRITAPAHIGRVSLPGFITRRLDVAAHTQGPDRPIVVGGARGWLKALLRYYYLAASTLALRGMIKSWRPDVLHVNNGGYPGAQSCRAAILAAQQLGVPVRVMMIHNLAFTRAPIHAIEQWLDRRVERSVTHLVTASLASREALARERGFDPQRIHNIYYGVATPDALTESARQCRAELGLDRADPLIGLIASFEPRKGHLHLLSALPDVIQQQPRARVVFLGSGGGNEEAVRQTANKLGVMDRLFFLGRRPDVLDWMSACDLIVLPSTDLESLPYVLLEAMSVGKPIIGTRVGGIPEEIEDGVTGYVVPPADVPALANAMIKILSDPDRAARMGQAARERVQRMFSLNQMIDTMQSIYTCAADKR
jgi:glycosyltransferase involved in cell wall biosynthesis